jgi:hypothetical protein
MDDDYLDHLRALDQGESDKKTDDNDDKTVDMSLEDGLAAQPEDDDSKCSMVRVSDSAADSVQPEEF